MIAIEIAAVCLGLLCVGLTIRQHIACWPTGIAMVSLYAVIFYEAKLYSDMLLQVVYVFLQIYGWHAWSRGGPRQTTLPVTQLSRRATLVWLAVCAAASGVWGMVMARHTDASFPFMDAFTTIASLIAQWLMGRKIVQSWLMWIAVDVVSIGLYLAKDLYLTAGLYSVFLVMAALGFFVWRANLTTPKLA